MKLLFDQNLSHRLTRSLSDVYCDCRHARHVGLKEAPDSQVWQFARNNGYTIVSKDSDFHQRSLLYGFPPKIVWVRLGNCSTKAVEKVLRAHCDELKRFHADETATLLIILSVKRPHRVLEAEKFVLERFDRMKKYLRSVFFAAVIGVVVLCGCAAPSEPDLLTAPVVFTFQRSKPYTYDVLGTVTNKTNKSIQHITVQIAMSK